MQPRVNPYSVSHRWPEATLDAFKSMPLYGGYVVALDFVKPKDLPTQEDAWRDWCKRSPRHLWPTWLDGWADRKARKARAR